MGKILKFKSCAQGGEYTGLGAITPTNYYYIGVESPSNIVNHINASYATDPDLAGKVTGIGGNNMKYRLLEMLSLQFVVHLEEQLESQDSQSIQ